MIQMNLAVEKVKLINWLTEQDEPIIEELLKWKEGHQRISINQYNKELEAAEAAIKKGKYVNHADAVKRIRSWREK